MRAALDTNLLVYAEGFGDPARVGASRQLLARLSDADLVVPLQCLGELFRVLTGKAGRSAPQAHAPSLWLWETANVLIQAESRGRITAAAIRIFLGLLESLPIRIEPASTAYDAAYLELAMRLGLPLACRDQALKAAARSEGVPLLPA
jgi:predicted nucleic acid-binding protein